MESELYEHYIYPTRGKGRYTFIGKKQKKYTRFDYFWENN